MIHSLVGNGPLEIMPVASIGRKERESTLLTPEEGVCGVGQLGVGVQNVAMVSIFVGLSVPCFHTFLPGQPIWASVQAIPVAKMPV